MIQIAKVIKQIKDTSSTSDKQTILARNVGLEGLKDVLKFIYDPYLRTGISQAKLTQAMQITPSVAHYTYMDMINYFKTHKTGSGDDLRMAAAFLYSTSLTCEEEPFALELAKAIVTQDLQIGVSVTTLNKVYGKDFIPKTGCMLGTSYEDVPEERVAWPCIITEKLDGIRRILIKENGVCRLYSRSGHEDVGLLEIEAEARHLPDNTVYDGELLAEGDFPNCIALRQATNSIANRKGVRTGVVFNIFDMVPVDEFRSGKSNDNATNRKTLLAATLMDTGLKHLNHNWFELIQAFGVHVELKHIKPVPILGLAYNFDEVGPIVNEIWRRGGEGVMLNTSKGAYEIKRSKELLKVKHTEERVLKVIDVLEGTGKFEGMMGALLVDYNGVPVGVGSGFTDSERQEIWDYSAHFIGKKVEIETFGESTNAYGVKSLNCPIFKRFVGGE